MRELNPLLPDVEKYYSEKISAHGSCPQGADWNSAESQMMRFDQLLRPLNTGKSFTINDYGCGYGALVEYLTNHDYRFEYRGFDISEKMIAGACYAYGQKSNCKFFAEKSCLSPADYTVASGIFNVKLQASESDWLQYILTALREFNELSRKGFAFNALTSYSDPEFMRPHLYYADALYLFDYCKRNFSSKVALLHDYPLYEFTIAVQLPGGSD